MGPALYLKALSPSYTQPHLMSVAQSAPHKRKRSSQESCEADDHPLISSKRQKADNSIQEARRAARGRFWDTLSKVWITPRALREFDRRNAARSFEQRCTSNLDPRSRKRSVIDTSHLSGPSLKNLKRFARRGGPSLVDLRSVSQGTIVRRTNAYARTCSVQNDPIHFPRP